VLEPLSLEQRSEARARLRRTLLSGRVLVADDLTDIRDLVGYMIRRAGVTVVEASDGREAVETALAAKAAGDPFDVLILDVQMPGIDGLAATRRLRAAGLTEPILALTAATMSGERERCLAAGCTEHLSKPIDESRLLRTLRRYLPRGEAPVTEAALAPGSTVLLVEDDPDARDATSKILGLLGWLVLEAGSGADALRVASEAAAPPVLALVDLSLPDMEGYELIRQLRANGCAGTRCVSLSGSAEDPVRARDVGVDQHLLKPVGLEELRAFASGGDRKTTS
jgi:CheY-like chemotaxis protein